MTGLDVAESRPLWLSLQHTLPSLGISDIPAYAAAGAVVAAVVAADALVITVDSAIVLVTQLVYMQFHLFPLLKKFSIYTYTLIRGSYARGGNSSCLCRNYCRQYFCLVYYYDTNSVHT